jgi:hypothetical protein
MQDIYRKKHSYRKCLSIDHDRKVSKALLMIENISLDNVDKMERRDQTRKHKIISYDTYMIEMRLVFHRHHLRHHYYIPM